MDRIKIEHLLAGFICLLLTAMAFWPALLNRASFDFHLHDTYFVVDTLPLILYAFLYCCLLFALYAVLRRKIGGINANISLCHVVVTIVFIGLLLFAPFFIDNNLPRRYLNYSGWTAVNDGYATRMKFFIVIGLLFILMQVVFFIYFLVKMIGKNETLIKKSLKK